MGNALQEQLLKTGLVTKKQIHKAKQDKNRKNKQQQSKKEKVVDGAALKIQRAAEEKAKRDRELNKKKEEQARQKAISIEINQLIENNSLLRDENCEVVYNFEHNKKVKRIYVNDEMKQQIIQGKLGIARIEGRYELVPQAIAEKIQQRNAKRIVIFDKEEQTDDKGYTSPEHQIPDDLTW
jgi:uncharacterized protein YaiL (DUF2058 family)